MEFLEQRFIRHFLAELCKAKELQSVVLVHDGLYIAPPVSLHDIASASEAAATASGLPVLQLTFKNLAQLWQRQFGHLERRIHLQQGPPKRSRHSGNYSDDTSADSLLLEVKSKHVLHFAPQTRKLVRKRAHIQLEPPASDTSTPPKIRKIAYTSRVNRQQRTVSLETTATSSTLHAYFAKKRLFGE
jgi:hypothetical protein